MLSRPPSSPAIAKRKPSPSAPTRLATGTRQSSKISCAVGEVFQPGFRSGEVGRSPDDPHTWILTTSWEDVGSMRRGLGSYAAKVALAPLLPSAADEPSTFEVLLHVTSGGQVEAGVSALGPSENRPSGPLGP